MIVNVNPKIITLQYLNLSCNTLSWVNCAKLHDW